MSINKEKQKIIDHVGNVLVTANPGTGKTRLLAYKYADLVEKGTDPGQILCLTFTEKAKKEMESRILAVLKKRELRIDYAKLSVFTFHSYALENINENEILSSNLLRYTIFKYLKDNEILNYGDSYLIDTIVPKLENLMRYLKSFGITPDMIDLNEVKKLLEEGKNYSKDEIDKFSEYFIDIFRHYEEIKNRRGVDYADLLIRFLELRDCPVYEYVLVDELQDVNIMEADIALKSCKTFIAVGDKKQAIFGFQGGSILNFEKFKDSGHYVLSENFRSTNEVLEYAREYFISKTKEDVHKKELKDLRNALGDSGPKPVIYDVSKDSVVPIACELAKGFSGKTAIIARTNYQIMDISKELSARGIEFSSTFFSASKDAKNHIITFIKGILSNDAQDIKNSMFTPFFPSPLQEVCDISEQKYITTKEVLEKLPKFRLLREKVRSIEDVNLLFRDVIIPISISYGKEYVTAAMTMQDAFNESISVLKEKSLGAIISYLNSADLLSQESETEKGLILTTVHKAKGREFENVIYIPSKTNNRVDFQDKVVEAILKTKGISADEELEEETLRVNFVAFTRAEKNLVILTDKVQDYLNEEAELKEISAGEESCAEFDEKKKRAYDLFVNGQYDEAKKLLEDKKEWIRGFVKSHFDGLSHTSFSRLPESAYDYFVSSILEVHEFSNATNLGSEVHDSAEKIVAGEEYIETDETKPFIENVKTLVTEIKKDYPKAFEAEQRIKIPLSSLGFDSDLEFKGYIDAIFTDGDEYLIVDWKTDKKTGYASHHRQQLEVYRRAFAVTKGIDLDKVKVAIGYVGLRSTINTGEVGCELDAKQPAKSAFNTFSKRVERLLAWIDDVDEFFEDFVEEEVDDLIWRSVVEECKNGF
ncbi:ATP-dependent helicase [Candidatus Woesearchaeota archaeon]|nr:ATP-dependent helicase [Candidatus Woesearchaeota archaeon]